MPGGICGMCGKSAQAHDYTCPRWRAAPRRSYRNATTGRGQRHMDGEIDVSVKRTKAKLREIIAALGTYQHYVLTRYQASTGVVVIGHGTDRTNLEVKCAEFNRDVPRYFPAPDGATYEVMPRSTLQLRLEKATDDSWDEGAVTTTSVTRSASLSTGT